MLGRYLLGYLPVQVAQALVGFGSVAVFTRIMPAEDYGRYALTLAAMSLTHILVFTWLEAAVARFHARAERRRRMREHLTTVYAVYALIALLAGAVLIGLIQVLPLEIRLKTALSFAAISMLLRALMQIGMETHRAEGDVRRFSALEASYLMLGFMIGVGIILTTGLGAAGVFIGTGIAALIMLVFDLPVMLRRARGGQRQTVRVAAYAAYGLPVTLSLIFEHLLSVGDRFLIAGFLGQGAVGMYAAGYGLADRLLDIIFIWFGAAVWPMTIRALEQGGRRAAQEMAGQAAGLMGLIAFPAAAGLALVAGPLTTVLVGESLREEAARILPWIALSGLMNGMMTYYFHEAFTLTRRTGVMAAIMSASAVLNLGLNLVFIPVFGLLGAALATVLVYALALVVCAVMGRRHFALPLPWGEWIKAGSATAIMAAAVLILPALPMAWQTLALQALVGAGVYAISAYLFDIAGCRQWVRDARALLKPAEATS